MCSLIIRKASLNLHTDSHIKRCLSLIWVSCCIIKGHIYRRAWMHLELCDHWCKKMLSTKRRENLVTALTELPLSDRSSDMYYFRSWHHTKTALKVRPNPHDVLQAGRIWLRSKRSCARRRKCCRWRETWLKIIGRPSNWHTTHHTTETYNRYENDHNWNW